MIALNRFPALPIVVRGFVSAGKPEASADGPLGFVRVPLPHMGEDVFGLIVRGNSMEDAGILHGNVVLVQSGGAFEDGDIAVVAVGPHMTLKRIYRHPTGYRLESANAAYPPLYVSSISVDWAGGTDLFGHTLPEVRVLGIMVGLLSESVFPIEPYLQSDA